MNFDNTLFRPLGLVFVLLLSFNLEGNCLDFQTHEKGTSDIAFLVSQGFLENINFSHPEKEPKNQSYGEFSKKDQSQRRETKEKAKKKDKSTFEPEQKKETSLKSYSQLKSALEEVDMMVSGWI